MVAGDEATASALDPRTRLSLKWLISESREEFTAYMSPQPSARASAPTPEPLHPFYRTGATARHPVGSARPGTELPPSFFIVGAPRCGSTALAKALKSHPQISFSKPKETHFFLEPRPHLSPVELRQRYLDTHHPNLDGRHRALGDGSVSYLYDPAAIAEALRLDPRARFIAMVRNPLDMVPSYHGRMTYTLDEDVPEFARAWALQEGRAAGRNIPRRCRDPRLLQYGEVGRLGTHVGRLFAVAGRDRCHVIVFDDLAATPDLVYRQVLDFIGIGDACGTTLRLKNENKGFRSAWLQQYVMNPPPWLITVLRRSRDHLHPGLRYLRRRFEELNTYRRKRSPLTPEMRATLRACYAEDVARLSELLRRDLSHWLR